MRYWVGSLLLFGLAPAALAQSEFPIADQISVTGSVLERTPANQSLDEISAERLDAALPLTLTDALRLSPAANITTNSRGETLVYLRNAGERQTALYFDGAAMNIPWDNRFSLSALPAGAIGQLAVQSGPASSLYGVNAAGGVIELAPVSAADRDRPGYAELTVGSAGLRNAALSWVEAREASEFLIAAQSMEHGDTPDLINTDQARHALLGRYRQDLSAASYVSATLLITKGDFGIAPARFDRDSQGRARYWRYRDADQNLAILRGGFAPSTRWNVHATLWSQSFQQSIDSYASSAYAQLEETQHDEDDAIGLRVLADGRNVLGGALRWSLTTLDSRHSQRETTPAASGAAERFADRRYSLGGEYERDWSDRLTLFAGASLDRIEVSDTGGRPAGENFETWNSTLGALWQMSETISLRPSLARKARIPTLRELYGAALNRFVPNPDLNPETLTSLDLEIAHAGDRWDIAFTPFIWQQDETLDQINISVNGERLRQRVNLSGAKAHGIEARFVYDSGDRWQLDGGFTAMHLRRNDGAGLDNQRFLAERPGVIARLAARYHPAPAWTLRAELNHRGRAYSFTDEDVFEPLPVSTALNLSARYRPAGAAWDAYVRIDNATDTRIEPQLGLREPGRWARAGLRLGFGG